MFKYNSSLETHYLDVPGHIDYSALETNMSKEQGDLNMFKHDDKYIVLYLRESTSL